MPAYLSTAINIQVSVHLKSVHMLTEAAQTVMVKDAG